MRLPFGKHQGVEIADLSNQYLNWLMSIARDLKEPIRSEVCREWQKRFDPPARAIAFSDDLKIAVLEIVGAGVRHLAREHHPDRGGATKTMTTINLAAEFLRRTIREAKK